MSRVNDGAAAENSLRHLSGLRSGGRVMITFPDVSVEEPR
jgi:hypothetical protein